MYDWKKLSKEAQQEILEHRRRAKLPWHSPPYFENAGNTYMLTAANYKHAVITGLSIYRMMGFQSALIDVLSEHSNRIYAWCILPNHYHALVETDDLKYTLYGLGQMHGRLSRYWNKEDNSLGRQCWYRCSDRVIRSERHLYTAVNYIHYNPVKHGYVSKMDEWMFSSAKEFLVSVDREEAINLWKKYPLLNYVNGWDE
jgi:putative transposase